MGFEPSEDSFASDSDSESSDSENGDCGTAENTSVESESTIHLGTNLLSPSLGLTLSQLILTTILIIILHIYMYSIPINAYHLPCDHTLLYII